MTGVGRTSKCLCKEAIYHCNIGFMEIYYPSIALIMTSTWYFGTQSKDVVLHTMYAINST